MNNLAEHFRALVPRHCWRRNVGDYAARVLNAGAVAAAAHQIRYGPVRSLPATILLRCLLGGCDAEVAVVLSYNPDFKLVGVDLAQLGDADIVDTTPQGVVRPAIRRGAAFAIFVHNHPNGIIEPSEADLEAARQHNRLMSVVGVVLYDWAVVTTGGVNFLRAQGVPSGLWREQAKVSEATARNMIERAPITPEEGEVFSEAAAVLDVLGRRPPPLPVEFLGGALREQLPPAREFTFAGLAADGVGVVEVEVLATAPAAPTDFLDIACRFAITSGGTRFLFAIKDGADFSTIPLLAAALDVALGEFRLQLLDLVVISGAGTWRSARAGGLFEAGR